MHAIKSFRKKSNIKYATIEIVGGVFTRMARGWIKQLQNGYIYISC